MLRIAPAQWQYVGYNLNMIKKTTQAIFIDGDYKGEYDWKGGIPLSEGEQMQVHIGG